VKRGVFFWCRRFLIPPRWSGASEAETFWLDFLRLLTRRGLREVKLVISDAHEGL
jgi:transposase-like protein